MIVALLLACVRSGPPVVVLVSLDTTRADALGCYGGDPAWTPNLDAFAASGAQFSWALAHAPTTLSSHATVMTGLDPHRHGIPRNGFPLAKGLETLAGRFHAAGFETAGVVGASVLGDETNISMGFDKWKEAYRLRRGNREEALAEDVTTQALSLLATRDGARPLFLFAHYFDAHAPYAAPPPFTRKFADPTYDGPFTGTRNAMQLIVRQVRLGIARSADVDEVNARYHGEVGYVDEQVGVLIRALPADATVLIFADHGEVLGEDRQNPFGHGGYVDVRSIHVPLLLRAPTVPARTVVDRHVRLMDIGPSLLSLAGLPATLGQGEDFSALTRGVTSPAPPSFAEATQPSEHALTDRWPNLPFQRSVASDGYLLLRWPLAQQVDALFHLDSTQSAAVDAGHEALLSALINTWDSEAPGTVSDERSDATRAGLRELGYTE